MKLLAIAVTTLLLAARPQDDAEAKKKRMGEILKELFALQQKAESDPALRKDPAVREKVDALQKEGDTILRALVGDDREKQDAVMDETIQKYAPELADEIAKAKTGAMEASARAALMNLSTAQEQFRLDYADYWVADVSGLNRILRGEASIRIIEDSMALADAKPCVALDVEGAFKADGEARAVKLAALGKSKPKTGYYVIALESYQDASGKTVKYHEGSGRSAEKYGFCAYPAEYGKTGRQTFMMGEDRVVWKKDTAGKAPSGYPTEPVKNGWEKAK